MYCDCCRTAATIATSLRARIDGDPRGLLEARRPRRSIASTRVTRPRTASCARRCTGRSALIDVYCAEALVRSCSSFAGIDEIGPGLERAREISPGLAPRAPRRPPYDAGVAIVYYDMLRSLRARGGYRRESGGRITRRWWRLRPG